MAQTENEIYYPGVSQADYQKIADILDELKKMAESIDEVVGKLVPKEEGKGLSTNDFSDEDKSVVDNAEDSENKVDHLSSSSTNDQYPGAKCVYDLIKLLKEVTGTFTTTYSTSESYEEGDIVVYEGKIYKCNDDTTGSWDSTKWDEISLLDEINQLISELENLDGSALQITEESEVVIYD